MVAIVKMECYISLYLEIDFFVDLCSFTLE